METGQFCEACCAVGIYVLLLKERELASTVEKKKKSKQNQKVK